MSIHPTEDIRRAPETSWPCQNPAAVPAHPCMRRLASGALPLALTAAAICGCGSTQHAAGAASAPGANGAKGANAAPTARGERRSALVDDAAIRRVLSYTSYLSLGTPRRMDVALTFDDGPGPYTARILKVLRREHAVATFFVIGRQARMFPALVARERRYGDAVGDHTQTHAPLGALPAAAQQAQIQDAASAIRAAGGGSPMLFRPPYGSFNATTLQILRAQHMLMVLWTADTKDFSQPGTVRIRYVAISGARPGAIILMHDGGGPREETVAALPRIIRRLRSRGFHLVTIPQLVYDDPPSARQPPPRPLSGIG